MERPVGSIARREVASQRVGSPVTGVSVALDVTALLLGLSVIVVRVVRYRRLRIDHVLLFVIGFTYYVSLSSLLAHAGVLPEYYANPFATFDEVDPTRRMLASLWSVLALCTFLGATAVADRLPTRRHRPPVPARIRASVVPAIAVAAAALGLFVLACIYYRSVLLEGYRSTDPLVIQAQQGRGTLAGLATASALASLAALHAATGPGTRATDRLVAQTVGVAAVALPILVLPIGGNRLYSVTLVLVIAVWWTHAGRPVRRSLTLAAGAIGFVGLVALGSLRIGQVPSPSTAVFYSTSESALGGWTRDLYLTSDANPLPPVALPRYLASDLVNLAPRALLPQKDSLRLDPAEQGFSLVSPLGGTNLAASMWLNFGFIGSLMALAALAIVLRRLQRRVLRDRSSSWTLTYAVLAAAGGLSFFRDEFGISIVRWGVMNALIIVGVIHVATRLVAVGLTPAPVRRRPVQRSLGTS